MKTFPVLVLLWTLVFVTATDKISAAVPPPRITEFEMGSDTNGRTFNLKIQDAVTNQTYVLLTSATPSGPWAEISRIVSQRQGTLPFGGRALGWSGYFKVVTTNTTNEVPLQTGGGVVTNQPPITVTNQPASGAIFGLTPIPVANLTRESHPVVLSFTVTAPASGPSVKMSRMFITIDGVAAGTSAAKISVFAGVPYIQEVSYPFVFSNIDRLVVAVNYGNRHELTVQWRDILGRPAPIEIPPGATYAFVVSLENFSFMNVLGTEPTLLTTLISTDASATVPATIQQLRTR